MSVNYVVSNSFHITRCKSIVLAHAILEHKRMELEERKI